ncbi:hypothetical protein FXO37_28052 [Capsicum annuum]|nr:hypothetical protein FXO37_28052 [Capsicum annuum]
MKDSSAGVIDGVFCWMDELRQIILYDSVNRHLWGLKLTHEMKKGYSTRVLGVSDGVLHYAMHNEAKVTVWCLKSDIRSQDAVWVKKYTTTLGVLSYLIHVIPVLAEVTSMEFHPDNPHILYFLVNGKFLSYDSENHNAELLYDIRKHTSKAGRYSTKGYPKVHFFSSSRESSELLDGSLDEATRQHFDVHVTQTSCIRVAAIGFHCKVDDPEEDMISFTIVRYEKSLDLNPNVTIESFSSETNAWTAINLTLDLPLGLGVICTTSWMKDSSAGVIGGVFCWIDKLRTIILYDSVNTRLWGLELTQEMEQGYSTCVPWSIGWGSPSCIV